MLGKLEQLYLSVLRVVILVAATLALVVAAISIVGAIPPLLKWSGLTELSQPSGGTLREFIAEKKAAGAPSEDLAETTTTVTTIEISPDISSASENLKKYLAERGKISGDQWSELLQLRANQMPAYGDEYASSVKRLSTELVESKGRPLSEGRVIELIEWHHAKFVAELEHRAAEQAQGNMNFLKTLGVSAVAFLAFVMIIFIFLFVKIERNLRLVRTVTISDEIAPDA